MVCTLSTEGTLPSLTTDSPVRLVELPSQSEASPQTASGSTVSVCVHLHVPIYCVWERVGGREGGREEGVEDAFYDEWWHQLTQSYRIRIIMILYILLFSFPSYPVSITLCKSHNILINNNNHRSFLSQTQQSTGNTEDSRTLWGRPP